MATFGGFLGPFSLKYGLSLLKFQAEVVFQKKKTASENLSKLSAKHKWDISKNDGFGPFWVQFTQKQHSYNHQITQVPGPT